MCLKTTLKASENINNYDLLVCLALLFKYLSFWDQGQAAVWISVVKENLFAQALCFLSKVWPQAVSSGQPAVLKRKMVFKVKTWQKKGRKLCVFSWTSRRLVHSGHSDFYCLVQDTVNIINCLCSRYICCIYTITETLPGAFTKWSCVITA